MPLAGGVNSQWLQYAPGLTWTVWLVANDLARRYAQPKYGSQIVEGMPLWRSWSGLVTQLLSLPLLFGHSYALDSNIGDWCIRCHRSGLSARDLAFAHVFGSLMLIDFMQMHINPLIMAHHIVCFICNLYASTVTLRAFPWYIAGVTALEIGSAGNGLNCLWPKHFTLGMYVTLMTVSNVTAAICTWQWASLSPEQPVLRWAGAIVSAGLIFMRQLESTKSWLRG